MWNNLSFDVLSFIFSFLSPDSLARARSTCKNWHTCGSNFITQFKPHESKPWFLALPIRSYQKSCCYAHNPITNNWFEIFLDFFPFTTTLKPIGPIGSLILLRVTNSTTLQLALCNPFTRQFKYLPKLHVSRTNPACGVVILEPNNFCYFPNFRIYVAGGMSEAKHGGATYEQTVEMYDSCVDTWKIVGSMLVEFSIRLTVWTPNENVCVERTKGTTLYWVTSARAYSVIGFDVGNSCWREFGVPLGDKLEFANLVRWNGGLGLVGGTCGGNVCVWEMSEEGDDKWCLVNEMPVELGLRLLCGKRNWEGVKCVSDEDAICLYREFGFGMVICRKDRDLGKWEWIWVDGCGYIKGKKVLICPIRGVLVHPTLASSSFFL
ncbi:F-box protein At5g49610-like [Cicer arietinum]|uniref:F-box/kelch-repeat protein At5g15710-like n=1 Tax=Cicer arietinum TaxID=3827 RepID=A0A1S2YME7_CICAR|nr:F-box/kelch-repeat protein At5g15710-like [Cicer arietinum]